MDTKEICAYAKINVGLDVLRKRADGYHEVSMIMQTINLYDTLTIQKISSGEIIIRTDRKDLPTDQENLIYRAARLFKDTYDIPDGLIIDLRKQIPIAAGLAGGSTDAAATLMGLNELYSMGLSRETLRSLGVKLGADVPFCLLMGTALSEGIGEVLTPIEPIPACTIVLVKPNFAVSTRYVYENLKLDGNAPHPDIPGMLDAIHRQDLYALAERMGNILETVTEKEHPVIRTIKEEMMQYHALRSLMSGSGPTVFGIFDDREFARKAYEHFCHSKEYQVFLTEPVWPSGL